MISDQLHTQSPEPIVTDTSKAVLPPYIAYVGINEAARLVGKAKQQIYRDIEAGKLSWNLDTPGKKLLQIADLDRVYKLKPQNDTSNETSNENQKLPGIKEGVTGQDTLETAIELARLQERLAAKDEALRKAEDQIRDLQQNRDRLLEQTNRLTMLLTAPPALITEASAPAEPIASEPPSPPQPWYKRLFQ